MPICGNVRYEDEPSRPRRIIGEDEISEEDDEDYGADAITRTLEKEFKLRNIEEEEKLSAGGMVAYRKRGIYQSVVGLKGSQAGGIQETVVLDELIHNDEEEDDSRIHDTETGLHTHFNPVHDSMTDMPRLYRGNDLNNSQAMLIGEGEIRII